MIRNALSLVAPAGWRARLTVFIFHRVLPAPDPMAPGEPDSTRFAQEVRWIGEWFNVLPLSEAISRLRSSSLPARPAAITFDDGYADNYSVALPILDAAGLTATFFVATGYLDGGRMWNDTIKEAVRLTSSNELDLRSINLGSWPLDSPAARQAAAISITRHIKRRPANSRAMLTAQVADHCAVSLPTDLMMSASQVRGLARRGMAIGAHTQSHPILRVLDDADARREIAGSKADVEAITGERVDLFAYPNGVPGEDYDVRHVVMVREAGYKAACSTRWGTAQRDADLYQLPRFRPWDSPRWRYGLRIVRNVVMAG